MAKPKRRTVRHAQSKKKTSRKVQRPASAKRRAASKAGRAAGTARGGKGGSGEKRRAIAAAKFAHQMVHKVVKDWPSDKLTAQPGGADNHVLWTLGHLVMTYAWLASMLDGTKIEVPESYNALYGHQVKPRVDASDYPDVEELRAQFVKAFETFMARCEKASDEELAAELPKDMQEFAHDRLALIERCSWHDGWHSGQLSTIRRTLGLPGVF